MDISSCIIPNAGNEIWNEGVSDITVRYTNLVRGEAAIGDPSSFVVWGEGNVEADPCFVEAGYWDDNGTADDPNDDFFVEGDYPLKSQAGRWDPESEDWVRDEVKSLP